MYSDVQSMTTSDLIAEYNNLCTQLGAIAFVRDDASPETRRDMNRCAREKITRRKAIRAELERRKAERERKREVRITWVEMGTNNAAALGLDELFETDWTDEECLEAARHHADVIGVNLKRYEPVIETVS